jgi:hypothetical protein
MKDAECSLTFAKVAAPNIINAMAKSPWITHPPNKSDSVVD